MFHSLITGNYGQVSIQQLRYTCGRSPIFPIYPVQQAQTSKLEIIDQKIPKKDPAHLGPGACGSLLKCHPKTTYPMCYLRGVSLICITYWPLYISKYLETTSLVARSMDVINSLKSCSRMRTWNLVAKSTDNNFLVK